MKNQEAEQFFAKGMSALEKGDTLSALVNFERATQLTDNPVFNSYLAYCIARERGQVRKGIMLCQEAINQEPENSVHYLNLGRIQLAAGWRNEAIDTLRQGLSHEHNQQIMEELKKLEPRKPPVIPWLGRENRVNKYLGIFLTRLGLR